MTLDDASTAYDEDDIGKQIQLRYVQLFRNLNHLLMLYDGPARRSKGHGRDVPRYARDAGHSGGARYMADWAGNWARRIRRRSDALWKAEEPRSAP